MQFRHPVFENNVHDVADGDADAWREAGWVEVKDEAPETPDVPASVEPPPAAPAAPQPAVATETPVTPVKEG